MRNSCGQEKQSCAKENCALQAQKLFSTNFEDVNILIEPITTQEICDIQSVFCDCRPPKKVKVWKT